MRVAAAAVVAALLAGCGKKPALGLASPLVDSGLRPFTLSAGYLTDGDSSAHLDDAGGRFVRDGKERVRRADGSEADPAEAARALEEWVAARVRVRSRTADASTPPEVRKTVLYDADRTTGTLRYRIMPDPRAGGLLLEFEIEEKLR